MFTSYSIENDKAWNDAVNTALKAGGSLKTPFKLVANDFYKSQKAIFNLSGMGQYDDYRSQKYLDMKLKKFGKPAPLKLTGKLEKSETNPNDPNALLDIKDTYMVIGTKAKSKKSKKSKKGFPYPAVLQEGGRNHNVMKHLFIGPEASRYATSEQMGRMTRWMGYVNNYIEKSLQKMGQVK